MAKRPKPSEKARATRTRSVPKAPGRRLDAMPDRIDLRDWMYRPSLEALPPELVNCDRVPEILDQGTEGACTGFALAAVVNYLLHQQGSPRRVSPRMLYEMARRYDEWPGEEYEGSSARGAMKGWIRHGVCTRELWGDRLTGADHLSTDLARDAMLSPGGAYCRVAHRQVREVHAALNETGIIYVTLMVHDGWQRPSGGIVEAGGYPLPSIQRQGRANAGHAVALVGYTRDGFIVQNSWGEAWGAAGFALLPYEDFMLHATDVWVAQLGVPVSVDVWLNEKDKANAMSGLHRTGKALPLNEIRPYIIDIGNNGLLSADGDYWTTQADLRRLVEQSIPDTTATWDRHRIMLYLHGGLNNEQEAASRTTALLGTCLANQVYPLHVLWETGFMETATSLLGDWFTDADKLSGRSLIDDLSEGRDWMVERSLARPLGAIWGEMKENAQLASYKRTKRDRRSSGAMALLAEILRGAKVGQDWELHVVAHSAGSIFFAHLLDLLVEYRVPLKTVQLMAPAMTVELFKAKVLPQVSAGACPRPVMYVLTEQAELEDTVGSQLVYGKSLLYLVSNACEPRRGTPILGMHRYVQGDEDLAALYLGKNNPDYILSGQPRLCTSASHGGFDNDAPTMNSVLARIVGRRPRRPFTDHDLRF